MALETPDRLHAALTVIGVSDLPDPGDVGMQITGSVNIKAEDLMIDESLGLGWVEMVQGIDPTEAVIVTSPITGAILTPFAEPIGDPVLDGLPANTIVIVPLGGLGVPFRNTITIFKVQSEPGPVITNAFAP